MPVPVYIGPLSWILVGGVAGWIASLLMGRDYKGGCCGMILLGMLGAVLGGIIFQLIGRPPAFGFSPYSILVAVVGSLVLLWLARLARGR